MKISVLTDNHPGSRTPAEHGLSYFIEYDGKKLLFDAGQSDMFLRNSKTMNISLAKIDTIVLSHGHFDHGNGLNHLSGHTLICHPGCFHKRYRKKDRSYIGLKNTKVEFENRFNLITSADPYKISEKIFFLGQIPRLTDFESKTTSFIFEDESPDFIEDDSALAFIMEEGLFVFTGCGHSGIVNTIEHARKVTGVKEVDGIMGGFHLKETDQQTKKTIRYLKDNRLKHVLPSHCTDLPALMAFHENFGSSFVRTGDVLTF